MPSTKKFVAESWDLDAAIKKTAPGNFKQIKRGDLSFIQKKEPRSMAEIEKNLWKNNITFTPRKKVDVLDINEEDFR